ncbi:conserved hypothetical protein [Ricinus communis]|uniref:Uncharacterized protein n=1 Tax=Ricinus communis TaxID=3988 RepID=B9RUF9_RICCO|nr:conserved hypothetical protein [Ricinus communis]
MAGTKKEDSACPHGTHEMANITRATLNGCSLEGLMLLYSSICSVNDLFLWTTM